MNIYGDISDEIIKIENGTAIAIGKFDGLHRGHKALIELIKAEKKNGLVPTVFTFARAPQEFIGKEKQKYVLTAAEKRMFIEKNGVEILVEQPLNDSIIGTEPEAFIRDILVEKLAVKKIFCGSDFRFGHKRLGDVALLKKLEKKYGYKTVAIDKLKYGERDISSTFIREEIGKGSIELLNKLLGYPYTIIGVVVEGQKLGRTLDFPTVNIIPEDDKMLPPNGVYFTKAIMDGKAYDAVTNIGVRPSVMGDGRVNVETHILDISKDLYGKTIELQFFEFERREKRFASLDELKHAVHRDIELRRGKISVDYT